MRKLRKIMRLESKRYLTIIIITGLIFIIACSLLLQFGINEYRKSVSESKSLINLEEKNVEKHGNAVQFGNYGYRQIGINTPLSPLFIKSGPLGNLVSFKDDGVRLRISKAQMGANAFDQPLGKSSMDYNWIYLFFGSVAFLILGFVTYHKKEDYVKFLLGFANDRTVYAAILVSKILVIFGFLVCSYLAVLLQFHLFNGIRLSGVELRNLAVFFFVPCFIMYLLSLILGMIFGKLKSTYKGVSLSILSWIMLVILIPEIFSVTLAKQTKSMFDSIYSHELKKLEIFSQAEKSVYKEVSKYTTPEEIKKAYKRLIQQYLDGDFKKIIALEKKMLQDMIKAAKKIHFYSIFTPVTFYKSVGNEISGYSYTGLIAFYKENISQYEKFVKYCLENTIDGKRPRDNPFIKNPEDYVVHLDSSLPKFFGEGVLFNLLILVVLVCFSFFRFKRFVFPKHKVAGAFRKLDYHFNSGGYLAFQCSMDDSSFPDQVYNVLMGRPGSFSGKISIDGKDIVAAPGKQDLIYLPFPGEIPANLKTKDLVKVFSTIFNIPEEDIDRLKEKFSGKLNKKFETIGNIEKIELLLRLALLSKNKIIMMNNLFTQITQTKRNRENYIEMLEKTGLKNESNTVIEFVSHTVLIHSHFDCYYSVGVSGDVYTSDIMHNNR